jgi:gliding motility-associated-like protein
MNKAPDWINTGNISTTNAGNITMTVFPDPSTGLRKFIIERRNGLSGSFENIGEINGTGLLTFTDMNADTASLYSYRVSAVNNCGNKVRWSNLAINIVLDVTRMDEDNIILRWNRFRNWAGEAGETEIILDKGDGSPVILPVSGGDSTLALRISDYMYQSVTGALCFRAVLHESANPYGQNTSATSNAVCTELSEIITVPNIFTPDGNLINDHFKPVLSFTPRSYELIITDTGRRIIFSTNDHMESWNGTKNGSQLPEGVYLWTLKAETSRGRVITKSGNVTLMMNR